MLSTKAIVALVLTTICSAQTQSFGALPDCAKPCAAQLPPNCKLDVKCICADAEFIKNISCCVADACSAQDLQKTLQVAQQLCSTVKVTLPAPGPDTCPNSGGGGGGGSSAASGAAQATSSAAGQASSQASSAAGGASSAASSAGTAASATAASSSPSPSAEASNDGVTQHMASKIGALGAAVAAVVLL